MAPEQPRDGWREIIRDCLARTHTGRIGTEALLRRVAATGTYTAGNRYEPSLC